MPLVACATSNSLVFYLHVIIYGRCLLYIVLANHEDIKIELGYGSFRRDLDVKDEFNLLLGLSTLWVL